MGVYNEERERERVYNAAKITQSTLIFISNYTPPRKKGDFKSTKQLVSGVCSKTIALIMVFCIQGLQTEI